MRKIKMPLILFLITLYSCSGSDAYQGIWKATDSKGSKFEIVFSPKSFSVKDSIGKTINYPYTQNSYKYENAVTTYGIQLDDGRGYQINFPKSNDETVGVIKDENGMPIFTLSRKSYLTYEELYKLN